MSASGRAYVEKHSPYRGATYSIHLALGDVANDLHENEVWMLADELARKSRTARQTVQTALGHMVADGFLEVVETTGGGRGRATCYRLLMPTREVVWQPRKLSRRTTVPAPKVSPRTTDTEAKLSPETTPRVARDDSLAPETVARDDTHRTKEDLEPKLEPKELAAKRRPDPIWDALVELYGPPSPPARTLYGLKVKELRELDATPDEILRRHRALIAEWGPETATPTALVKHWGRYDPNRNGGWSTRASPAIRAMQAFDDQYPDQEDPSERPGSERIRDSASLAVRRSPQP